jgi:hypothetical protein
MGFIQPDAWHEKPRQRTTSGRKLGNYQWQCQLMAQAELGNRHGIDDLCPNLAALNALI